MRSFASDNTAGVHPEVMQALSRANTGHVAAYGQDEFTARACAKLGEHFGAQSEAFFVFNGTAANVLGLETLTRPYGAVLCASSAHIENDECGAPERFLGCKLITRDTPNGKLTPELLETAMLGVGVEHHVQPQAVSISQTTEFGTVYRPSEIRRLADFAHGHGMKLHMDGARLANAAAALGLPLAALTTDVGVDVLSFGGAKNGLMYGEAVVFFDPKLAANFKYARKQGMQLASKMRFIAAQFEALLSNDLWLKSAMHANRLAGLLAKRLEGVAGVQLTQKVEANALFLRLPPALIAKLLKTHRFYVWNEAQNEVRWMLSFDSTEEDVEGLLADITRQNQ